MCRLRTSRYDVDRRAVGFFAVVVMHGRRAERQSESGMTAFRSLPSEADADPGTPLGRV